MQDLAYTLSIHAVNKSSMTVGCTIAMITYSYVETKKDNPPQYILLQLL